MDAKWHWIFVIRRYQGFGVQHITLMITGAAPYSLITNPFVLNEEFQSELFVITNFIAALMEVFTFRHETMNERFQCAQTTQTADA